MGKGRGRKGGGRIDSCRVPFHYTFNTAFTAGTYNFSLSPASFPRILAEADAWALFRVPKFSFRMLPTSPVTVAQACGFLGAVQDNNPVTFATLTEILPCAIKGVGQTTPTQWVHVTKRELAGPFPWYKTIAGTPDGSEEQPGFVFAVGTGTEAVIIETRGIFEFKIAVATANTPLAQEMRRALRAERTLALMVREKEQLMRILAAASPPENTPPKSIVGVGQTGF